MIHTFAALYALYWLAWLALGGVVGCVILWRRVIQTATAPRRAAERDQVATVGDYDMATGYYPRAVPPASEGLGEPPVLRRAHSPTVSVFTFDDSAWRALREIAAEHPEGAA